MQLDRAKLGQRFAVAFYCRAHIREQKIAVLHEQWMDGHSADRTAVALRGDGSVDDLRRERRCGEERESEERPFHRCLAGVFLEPHHRALEVEVLAEGGLLRLQR